MAILPALFLCLFTYQAVVVELHHTERIPDAHGNVALSRGPAATEIVATLDDLKPASLFGGDFNTYILWLISSDGVARNSGEFVLVHDHTTLRTRTELDAFDLMVTAEPHYLVTVPSRFVILKSSTREYSGPYSQYNFERDRLVGLKEAKGLVHNEQGQAYTALRLAQRAGADAGQLRHLWQQLRAGGSAREIVREAVAAQRIAEE